MRSHYSPPAAGSRSFSRWRGALARHHRDAAELARAGCGFGARIALRAEVMQQLGFARACHLQIGELDMAEAAHAEWQCCDLRGERLVGGRKIVQQTIQQLLEFGDQPAFAPPFARVAERIERRAAQRLAACQPLECRKHPVAEAHLRGTSVTAERRQKGRREMKLQLQWTFERLSEPARECAVAIKARDLVLVLVAHEL